MFFQKKNNYDDCLIRKSGGLERRSNSIVDCRNRSVCVIAHFLKYIPILNFMAKDAADGDLLDGAAFGYVVEFRSGAIPDLFEDAFG